MPGFSNAIIFLQNSFLSASENPHLPHPYEAVKSCEAAHCFSSSDIVPCWIAAICLSLATTPGRKALLSHSLTIERKVHPAWPSMAQHGSGCDCLVPSSMKTDQPQMSPHVSPRVFFFFFLTVAVGQDNRLSGSSKCDRIDIGMFIYTSLGILD